jgi:hypothetical protein
MKNILRITGFFLVMSLTWAQQTTGKISGKVTDNAGAGLAGANVIVDGTSMGGATDNDGKYTILNVPAGTFSLTASYIGYRSTTTSNVEVKTNLTTPQDFSMESSAIEGDAVTIVGQKRLVEFSATNSVRSVNAEEIQNAASRSVTGMLDMQAGVTITNGKLHIRGSRAEEVAYTLDGAQITDVINPGRDVSAIPEALAEISVEAGGYGAHVGGANSGVVRQTMRTGGNEIGGNVRFETGDFGYQDVTATLGGPVGPVKFFGAVRQSHTDDSNPSFFTDFMIDLDGDGNADELNSYVQGVVLDGDTKKIDFSTDDGTKIDHRKRDNLQVNGTATMDLGPINLRLSGVIDNQSGEGNGLPILNLFNSERQSEYERKLNMMTVRGNYFINSDMLVSVGVSTLNRTYESYDGLFGKPGSFSDVLGWGDSATVVSKYPEPEQALVGGNWRSSYQSPNSYYFGQFPFAREGAIATGWGKNERSSVGIDAGLTWQRGDHEIRLGFDQKNYSYRRFSLGTGAIGGINRMIAADTTMTLTLGNAEGNADVTKELAASNRGGQIGYDDYGNYVDDGSLDGPREPSTTSFYVNDKYEAGDVVISLGVRVDQFNMDDWKLKDPLNPPWDELNKSVYADGISDSDTKTEVQPRLGMAFPVSDEIVFHLQYGKFAQMPELDLPYAATRYMHLIWGGQNYTPDPMGFDLDPVLTTQYEVGVSYQFLPDAAIDVTAFAKNTTGQIVLGVNPNVELGNTNNAARSSEYMNGDFTTVNGFEFTLRTRRINRLQSFASYTYSDARGVNSDPNSNAGNLDQSMLSPPPMMINPLYYTNKHRGAVSLDYRFGGLLSGLGANVQYKFNSGHPYTLSDGGMGQRAAYAGALLTDARSREPQEPIGQSTTPWQTNINLKVDYNISVGNYGLTVFAYVENLMNTKNVENVYSRSGNAYDDGFLTDPALSSEIVAAQGDIYTTMYQNVNLNNRQHYTWDYGRDLFSTPRIVKFGASVNF